MDEANRVAEVSGRGAQSHEAIDDLLGDTVDDLLSRPVVEGHPWVDQSGGRHATHEAVALDHQCAGARARGREGGGEACGASAGDDDIEWSGALAVNHPDATCSSWRHVPERGGFCSSGAAPSAPSTDCGGDGS